MPNQGGRKQVFLVSLKFSDNLQSLNFSKM